MSLKTTTFSGPRFDVWSGSVHSRIFSKKQDREQFQTGECDD
jgi:hypothetical protein